MLRTSMDWLFRSSDGPPKPTEALGTATERVSQEYGRRFPSRDPIGGGTVMPTAEQCNAYAAEYRLLVQQVDVSIRRAATLMAISQSWTILADQLERLADITKDEMRHFRRLAPQLRE